MNNKSNELSTVKIWSDLNWFHKESFWLKDACINLERRKCDAPASPSRPVYVIFPEDLKFIKREKIFRRNKFEFIAFRSFRFSLLIRRDFYAIPFIFYSVFSWCFRFPPDYFNGQQKNTVSNLQSSIFHLSASAQYSEQAKKKREMRNYPNGSNWCNSLSDFALLFLVFFSPRLPSHRLRRACTRRWKYAVNGNHKLYFEWIFRDFLAKSHL